MTAGHERDDAAMQAVVLAGLRSAKSMREIAVDPYGTGFRRRRRLPPAAGASWCRALRDGVHPLGIWCGPYASAAAAVTTRGG